MTTGNTGYVPPTLPQTLVNNLNINNPWWNDREFPRTPPTRRNLVQRIRRRIDADIAPIVAIRGPRQVGKSTMQLQIISDLLQEGVPPRHIMRVQFDELAYAHPVEQPILQIVQWFEHNVAPRQINALANEGNPVYIFFDEAQNIDNWSEQLKFLVDTTAVKVVVTGSSALRIQRGRDSLAGRIHTVNAPILSLSEIAHFRGIAPLQPFLNDNGYANLRHLDFWRQLVQNGRDNAAPRDEAFRLFSQYGGYPFAHSTPHTDLTSLNERINENVVQRMLRHDLQGSLLHPDLDPQILSLVFHLACRYAGQAPSYGSLAQQINQPFDDVDALQVANYMEFLDDTMIVRLVHPLEFRLQRTEQRPKICLSDHAIRATQLDEPVPLAPSQLTDAPNLATIAGHLAESTFGAALADATSISIHHRPQRGSSAEIDYVVSVGDHRVPVEIKYQRNVDLNRDARALRVFIAEPTNRATFGVIITRNDVAAPQNTNIVAVPLSTFLLLF